MQSLLFPFLTFAELRTLQFLIERFLFSNIPIGWGWLRVGLLFPLAWPNVDLTTFEKHVVEIYEKIKKKRLQTDPLRFSSILSPPKAIFRMCEQRKDPPKKIFDFQIYPTLWRVWSWEYMLVLQGKNVSNILYRNICHWNPHSYPGPVIVVRSELLLRLLLAKVLPFLRYY